MAGSSRTLNGPRTQANDEELALARQLKARSIEAWSELYATHYARLFRYAHVRLSSREEAEDITDEVFVRALSRVDSYKYEGTPIVAWLYGICQNLLKERHRRVARHSEITLLPPDFLDEEIASAGADDGSETIDLQRALNKLTRPQQEVISLLHFGGFSTNEVASMLGKTRRAVNYLEARALTRLRDQLQLDAQGHGQAK